MPSRADGGYHDTAWERKASTVMLAQFEAATASATSQREFAREHEVARTTLQHWVARKSAAADSSPAAAAFFESPAGLEFLHRFVTALHFVLCFLGPCGLRMVAQVIELAGLSPFVGNSFGSHQKLGVAMEDKLRKFGAEQQATLATNMQPKDITACQDETFHPEPCLVAIEPVSNFILLEAYAEGRDAATWDEKLSGALKGLPVRVIQSTSDEGKGLLRHAQKGLGAHHSPDLFHGQQELTRATSVGLAAQVRHAEREWAAAVVNTQRIEEQANSWVEESHGPGRPPNFQQRIADATAVQHTMAQTLASAREHQETARQAVRGIGEAYHPVDLATGAPRSAADVTAALEGHFAAIATVAVEAALPERCHAGIRKAHRLLPFFTSTLVFFHSEVKRRIDGLGLTDDDARIVERNLVPAAYLDRAGLKAQPADARPPLFALAHKVRNAPEVLASSLAALPPEKRDTLDRVVNECADLFQRASSCVEGRNGQLALHHHGIHRISPHRLEALTVVHNYFLERPDGTTAAERFFGAKPEPLFPWLLKHLPMPARPAPPRPRRSSIARHAPN